MSEQSLLAKDWFDKGARDLKRVGILAALCLIPCGAGILPALSPLAG